LLAHQDVILDVESADADLGWVIAERLEVQLCSLIQLAAVVDIHELEIAERHDAYSYEDEVRLQTL
jgi:hypothetical protein